MLLEEEELPPDFATASEASLVGSLSSSAYFQEHSHSAWLQDDLTHLWEEGSVKKEEVTPDEEVLTAIKSDQQHALKKVASSAGSIAQERAKESQARQELLTSAEKHVSRGQAMGIR